MSVENKNTPQSKVESLALVFTKWVGSPASIITHTIIFILAFVLVLFGASLDSVLLILTTAVSLEAIYLAIFIQMSVNRQGESIQNVEEDIDEIQGDIDEIQDDVDEMQEDVEEMQVDVEEIQEDIDEIAEEEESKEVIAEKTANVTIDHIYDNLKKLMHDVERLKGEVGDIRKQ